MNENRTSASEQADHQAAAGIYPIDKDHVRTQLDEFAHLAASLCDARIGLVSLVEMDRQRFVGRSGVELDRCSAGPLFSHALLGSRALVVTDASHDWQFRDDPLVTGLPFARFYVGQPVLSREGVAVGILSVIDHEPRDELTQGQLQALETLAGAVMTVLECARLERISDQYETRSKTEIADLEQRFRVLADAMPQLVWSTTSDGMADYFNRVWCEFTGMPAESSYGQRWTHLLHEDDRDAAEQCWATAVESGRDYEIEYRLHHHDGSYRWVLARGIPLQDASGEITRWIGTCTDIHEQKADAERLEVLSRELSHRIKNIFAVIGGLIALTIRNKPEFSAPALDLRDRILSLGRAHDFVRSSGGRPLLNQQARLVGLLQALLAPYQDEEGQRIAISGADVAVDDRSATPLALFFHELATNAAKYGSLSREDGRVEIRIADGDHVELQWCESGGPMVVNSGERGFGSSLVEMSIVRQLSGTLDYDWQPQGLRVIARIPAAIIAR